MKKTLIAVAALAATSAFAQVTVTGTWDATLRNIATTNAAGANSGNQMALGQNGSGTSNITFSVMEDLGGGLKAVGLVENDFDASTNGGVVGGGQTFVGLEGAFGSFKAGSVNSPALSVQGARTPFGTKDGGRVAPTGNITGTSLTRYNGSMMYSTPMMSGFQAQLDYVPKASDTTGTDTAGAQTDLGLFYANGPISAGVSLYTKAGIGGAKDQKMTNYQFTYDLRVAKVTLSGYTEEGATANVANKASTESSGLGLAAAVPLSAATTLQAAYQTKDDKDATNMDGKEAAIGVNYALSKRTAVYARYVNVKYDNVTAGAESATTTLFGLRHNF